MRSCFFRWLAGLFLGLLAGASVNAEPLGFKGMALGSAFAQDPRFDCRAVKTPLGDSICSLRAHEQETIAAAPVRSLFRYYHVGYLSGIVIHFDARHFPAVVEALAGKYGQGRLSTETVENYEGKRFENQAYAWQRPEGSLALQRYSGRLDQSSLRITDLRAVEAVKRQRAAQRKDPQQDL